MAGLVSTHSFARPVTSPAIRAGTPTAIMPSGTTIPGGTVWFCSDEHTTFAPDEPRSLRVGDRVRVLPAHVDPTVALHERMHLVAGDEVVETWPVDLRGW